jgi:hypothetical protein
MEKFQLPFATFGKPLRDLLTATANKLEREWDTDQVGHPLSKPMLLSIVLAATNAYDAILYLCADTPHDAARKPEFALAAPSLSRVVLEALFTTVFALEDLDERTTWFHKAGWREVWEEVERARARYAGDPRWDEYIAELELFLHRRRDELGVTEEEAQNPRKLIKHWPNPSRMKHADLAEDRRQFLQHLEDWFYRALSQDAHLSFRGLARHSRYLLLQMVRRNDPAEMTSHKSEVLGTTIILLLALLSEFELAFRFGLTSRISFVWGVINPAFPQGREVFEQRYAGKLDAA